MSIGLGINIAKIFKSVVMPKFGKYINKAFSEKYLLLTNVGLSLCLSGVGDILQQRYEILNKQIKEWDKTRTTNMTLCGTSVGIVCHFWYQYLDKLLPGYTLRIVLKKIVIDQLVGSPIFISTFFLTFAVLEGATKEEFIEEIKHKAWRLYAAEWIIWPPAQFINFYLLPTKFRVLFDNTVSLGYDIYTSYVKHNISTDDVNNKDS